MFLSLYPKQCVFKFLGGAQWYHEEMQCDIENSDCVRMILQLEAKLIFKEPEISSCMRMENYVWRGSLRSFCSLKQHILHEKENHGETVQDNTDILYFNLFLCNLYHVLLTHPVWITVFFHFLLLYSQCPQQQPLLSIF